MEVSNWAQHVRQTCVVAMAAQATGIWPNGKKGVGQKQCVASLNEAESKRWLVVVLMPLFQFALPMQPCFAYAKASLLRHAL